MGLVLDLRPGVQLVEAVGPEAAERENVPELLGGSADQHLEDHAEGKCGNRVADKNGDAGSEIEKG